MTTTTGQRIVDRIPPHDKDAELAVLSSLMLKPDLINTVKLEPGDFYDNAHGHLFRHMQKVMTHCRTFDLVMLKSSLNAEKLQGQTAYDYIGGGAFLGQVAGHQCTATHLDQYASVVANKARQRRLIAACERTRTEAYNLNGGPASFDRLLSEHAEHIQSLVIWDDDDNGECPPNDGWKPFPVDALPEPLGPFVDAAARAMVCDASFVALPLLAALASAIGSTRRVVLKGGWSEPAIVWTVLVGESGTTKTPAFKLMMRPIRHAQRRELENHAQRLERYEVDTLCYERELSEWKKRKRKSDDADDAPPAKPQEPQAVRYIVSDTTVEALAPLLSANPRGLLLARDELAGWLGSFDRYAKSGNGGGADSAHWLSMHNGESMIVDRKTGSVKTVFVSQAYVSICGCIQPGILHRALGIQHRESGLAARLLLACPPRKPKRWTDEGIDPDAEVEFAQILARLYELQPTTDDDGQPCPVFVGMTADAKRLWVDYFNAHGDEQVDMSGELSAAWSKLEGYAARLALIIHYARWAADDASLQHPDRIDADSMRRAVTLVEWFKQEARRVYGVLGETDEEMEQRQLVEWIGRKGGAVTARELQQGPRRYRVSRDTAERALEELVRAGLGTWQPIPTTEQGGRPGRSFRLGNSGYGYTTPLKPE